MTNMTTCASDIQISLPCLIFHMDYSWASFKEKTNIYSITFLMERINSSSKKHLLKLFTVESIGPHQTDKMRQLQGCFGSSPFSSALIIQVLNDLSKRLPRVFQFPWNWECLGVNFDYKAMIQSEWENAQKIRNRQMTGRGDSRIIDYRINGIVQFLVYPFRILLVCQKYVLYPSSKTISKRYQS